MTAQVLLLGGTSEARELAGRLDGRGIGVISSLAGRVADPRLPVGEVRIGGFGGISGLRDWLREHDIAAIVDATHPYATTISAHAVAAATATGTPLLRLRRPAWTPGPDDAWHVVPTIADAADEVDRSGGRVFLTTGRQDVGAFTEITSAWFLIRVVDAPDTALLPAHHRLLRSRGPYRADDEATLMRTHRVDTLVTKNSGGALTRGKLDAARHLGVRVIMIDRPDETGGEPTVSDADAAADWVTATLADRHVERA